MRARIVSWKYPETTEPRTYAAAQLIQGALFQLVLNQLGEPITEQQIAKELARIDSSSRDPEGLERLKTLCGGGESDAYRRIAILPDFANRRFHFEVYPNLDSLHAEALRKAQHALRALAPLGPAADLQAFAKTESAWHFSRSLFHADRGFYDADAPLQQTVPANAPSNVQAALGTNGAAWQRYERELFATTPEGQLVNRVVTQAEGFELLRWSGWADEAGGVRRVERLWLGKRPADEAFWDLAGTFDIGIADPLLREQLLERIPWMQRVKLGEALAAQEVNRED